MTTENKAIKHFEEWCDLDPKLPVSKNGDGEYENQTTFDFWKCAEFMFKKGVWCGAYEMQKLCDVDYDKVAAYDELMRDRKEYEDEMRQTELEELRK